jgi:hypothetical protein
MLHIAMDVVLCETTPPSGADMRSITVVGAREGTPVAVLSLNQPKFLNPLRCTLVPAAAVVVS